MQKGDTYHDYIMKTPLQKNCTNMQNEPLQYSFQKEVIANEKNVFIWLEIN